MASKSVASALVSGRCAKFRPRINEAIQDNHFWHACLRCHEIGLDTNLWFAEPWQRYGFIFVKRTVEIDIPPYFLLPHSETIASLQAFRKRHTDAQRIHNQYSTQPTTVDLNHYRSILKNQEVVAEAEKILKEFKPVTYDVNAHIKAIESFEVKAVCTMFYPRNNNSCWTHHWTR